MFPAEIKGGGAPLMLRAFFIDTHTIYTRYNLGAIGKRNGKEKEGDAKQNYSSFT